MPKKSNDSENVIINQPVSRDVYKYIKMIATEENKYIAEVVEDALRIYGKSKGFKI
jgi:hypothetical protein